MKIFIASDGAAAPKLDHKRPETGWGECLKEFIGPMFDIYNLAENGLSTKSFIEEGRLDIIDEKIQKGDILLIQFGYEDALSTDPSVKTTLSQFTANLDRIAKVASSHEALPVFVSPIAIRKFNDNILIKDVLLDYPNALITYANNYGYRLLNMYKTTQNILQKLGDESSKKYYMHLNENESENYPKGTKDDVNLSHYGARQFASIIAAELMRMV